MTRVVSLDFELCSTVDLRDVGTYEWAVNPNTLPILAAFALDHEEPRVIEFEGLAPLAVNPLESDLLAAIRGGAEIHAWNANFEFNVWNNICAPRFGWPRLPIERFHCTMAAAACAGLPMKLERAADAVSSPHLKAKAGHLNMLRLSKPRSDKGGVIRWWHREEPARLQQLIDYCADDVRAEREVHLRIPRMSARERQIWLVEQHMNQRGLPVDRKLMADMYGVMLQETLRLNTVIAAASKGVITHTTQNKKILEWAQAGGYPHASLDKDTLLPFVETPDFAALPDDVREVLATRAEAAKSSTAKLITIDDYSKSDGVARNLIQYGGAVRTLRWAGRGPQIQNFPRPTIKDYNVAPAIEQILLGADGSTLRHLYGNALDVISSCLRGVFKAYDGCSFVIADYHAIEAIVLAWLAEFDDMLDVFKRGEDIYVFTAKGVGSDDRKLGKVLRLACGYGMGWAKFLDTAAKSKLFLNPLAAQQAVANFRAANGPIVKLWHGCEATARNAILRPGERLTFKRLMFRMADPKGRLAGSLLMELPSGRNLVYRNARLDAGRIIFWGVDQITGLWRELDTYGGKLVENATQAVARDLLADAMVALDARYPETLRTTVHDEIVAMTDDGSAPDLLAAMKAVMSAPPAWGRGLPLSAAGAIVKRYGKL